MPDDPKPFRAAFRRNRNDSERLALVVVEGPLAGTFVRAHYNPHEVSYDRTTTWNPQRQLGAAPEVQHTQDGIRTMTVELMFDCFELPGETLEDDLATLEAMMTAPDPEGDDAARKPPVLDLANGPITGFRCVITSLAVKVTMFDRTMKPVRATASLKLTEVANPNVAKRPARSSRPGTNCLLTWTKAELDLIDSLE